MVARGYKQDKYSWNSIWFLVLYVGSCFFLLILRILCSIQQMWKLKKLEFFWHHIWFLLRNVESITFRENREAFKKVPYKSHSFQKNPYKKWLQILFFFCRKNEVISHLNLPCLVCSVLFQILLLIRDSKVRCWKNIVFFRFL